MSERIAGIEARLNNITPGQWKIWGMSVMADPVGNSNVDDAHMIARTTDPHRGLRTWNAQFIANAPADVAYLLTQLRARDEALGRVEAECRYLDTLADGDKYYAKVIRAAAKGHKA